MMGSHTIPAAGGATIATGSYTGNGGADRQITVGFKCSMVIIFMNSATNFWSWVAIPSFTGRLAGGSSNNIRDTSYCFLHSTDGFQVDVTNGSNTLDWGYFYWAVSE